MGGLLGGQISKWIRGVFLVLFGALGVQCAYSTHVMGADMTWEKVGNDTFKVTLMVYRDCHGVPLANTDIVATSNCGRLDLTPTKVFMGDVTPICDGQCTNCSPTSCSFNYGIEAYELVVLFDFSDWRKMGCCEVALFWQQCCRNTAITTGAANMRFFIDGALNICVSGAVTSPKWQGIPVALVCRGQELIHNFGALDFDVDSTGKKIDSLVYAIDTPKVTDLLNTRWGSSYSHESPFVFQGFPNNRSWSFPKGFHFDESSGVLDFVPARVETSIMSIRVEEYRGGVKIGEAHREIQMTITSCMNTEVPSISSIDCSKWGGASEVLEFNRCVGDSIEFDICTEDANLIDSVSLSVISDLPKGAAFKIINPGSSRPVGRVSWVLDSAAIMHAPWTFTFKAVDNSCPIQQEKNRTFRLFIGPGDSFPTSFNHQLTDTACGKYLLWGGSLDTLPVISQYWYVNDTLVGNGDSVVFTPNSLDTQFVKILVNLSGCFHAFYDTLIPPSFRPIRIESLLDTALCSGATYSDSIVARGGKGPYSYSWDISGPSIPKSIQSSRDIGFTALADTLPVFLQVTAMDTLGCTGSQFVELNILNTYSIDLVNYYYKRICPEDSMEIKLKTIPSGIGNWEGPGVDNNVFRTSKLPEGTHRLYYQTNLGEYCIVDDAIIIFGIKPDVQVVDRIETCLDHIDIPLKAYPSGGRWYNNFNSGSGIVRDSFFQYKRSNASKHTLTYVYASPVGCLDTGITIVDIRNKKFNLNVEPDGNLCSGYSEMKLSFNADSIWKDSDTERRVKQIGMDWYTDQNALKFGVNDISMIGVDANYCLGSDVLSINYLPTPTVALRVKRKSLCAGGDSLELKIDPDSARIFGRAITDVSGKKYFIPVDSTIGYHQFVGLVTAKNGCIGIDSIRIEVKDTINRPYQIDTFLCAYDTIALKNLTDSGYWSGTVNTTELDGHRWYAMADRSHAGKQSVVYHTYLDSACFYFEESSFRVQAAPKPKILKEYEVCVNGNSVELKAAKNSVEWYGPGVRKRSNSFEFFPRASLIGENYVTASDTDNFGCSGFDMATVVVFAIPSKPFAGYDDILCMEQNADTVSYLLEDGLDKWTNEKGDSIGRRIFFNKKSAQRAYQYVLNKANDDCSNSDTVLIHLGRKIVTSFDADVTSGVTPLKVRFSDQTPGSVYTRWFFGTGDSATNNSNPIYTYNDTGKFDVLLIAYDSMRFCGNSHRKTAYISVSVNNSIFESQNSMNVFPNPVKDVLTINSEVVHKEVSYRVYDLNGRMVHMGQVDLTTDTQINVSDLEPSTYLLELLISDGDKRNLSFIKE